MITRTTKKTKFTLPIRCEDVFLDSALIPGRWMKKKKEKGKNQEKGKRRVYPMEETGSERPRHCPV